MSRLKIKVSFLACAFISSSVIAGNAAEEIARMNESIAVLSAQKTELELKSQIASKQIEFDRMKSAGAIARTGSGSGSGAPAEDEMKSMPTIKGIEGIDGKLSAGLLFSNGAQKIVRAGEKIPGGWTVAKIEVDSVSLVRKRETIRLEFVHAPTPSVSSPASPAAHSPLSSFGSAAAGSAGVPPFPVGR